MRKRTALTLVPNPSQEPAEPTRARGVLLSKVSRAALDAARRESGLELPRSATLEQRVLQLADFDAKEIGADKEKGGACDECEGISLQRRPVCPYCGVCDEQPTGTAVAGAAPTPEVATAVPMSKPAPSKKLAKTGGSSITPAEVRELDQVTRRLRGLIGDAGASLWQLGRELTAVMKQGQYKFRVKDGVPVHQTFDDFCAAELGLSGRTARNLMALSQAYTKDQARELGVRKGVALLRFPPGERPSVQEAAALPARQLEAKSQGRERQSTAKPTRAVAPGEGTGVIVPEIHRLPAFATERPGERAKCIEDRPFVTFELQNGLRLRLEWAGDADGLKTIMTHARLDDAEPAAE